MPRRRRKQGGVCACMCVFVWMYVCLNAAVMWWHPSFFDTVALWVTAPGRRRIYSLIQLCWASVKCHSNTNLAIHTHYRHTHVHKTHTHVDLFSFTISGYCISSLFISQQQTSYIDISSKFKIKVHTGKSLASGGYEPTTFLQWRHIMKGFHCELIVSYLLAFIYLDGLACPLWSHLF